MIGMTLRKIFTFVFPAQCIICAAVSKSNLCDHCAGQIPFNLEQNLPWAFSLYTYRNKNMAICVRHLKNFPDTEIIDQLISLGAPIVTAWFEKLLLDFPDHQFICLPVPLHTSRFAERGYNQALCITESFLKYITSSFKDVSITINSNLLRKEKLTKKQALVADRNERLKNINGAFCISKKFLPRDVSKVIFIIIDDITTTGGTLSEIKNVLDPYTEKIVAFTLGH